MTIPLIEVRDAFVAYPGAAGSVMALRGADLTLVAGERLLVLGPNGSGKSTLLRVITGEQAVAAGTVVVAGTTLHDLDAGDRRVWRARSVGFIDQFAGRSLLPELPVLDNVALQLRLTGSPPAAARERAREACAQLGLEALLARDVRGLSGGEAQRVAVCAAVAHRPLLLLADEPTGELDERSAGEVYDLLARIAGTGTGVVLVSHDPRAVAASDRAVRIRDGRAAEQWQSGSAVVEQLPDSRGWVRLPRERLPGLDPMPPLEARRTAAGVLLVPRVRAVDPAPPRPGAQPAAVSVPVSGKPLAQLCSVTAGYGELVLLDGLELVLEPGTWTVVTGVSGSGKSTLFGVLAGLLPVRGGTITVGDRSWTGRSRAERAEHRRRWLALLPQRPALLEALTVRENLQLTAGIRGPAPVGAGELELLADRLALARLLDQPVHSVSGGERQRAALARTLISAAPLLLLDEPTSQQDEESVERITAVLEAERAAGRAVLTATHDARVVAAASTAVELAGGRLRPPAG